MPVGSPLFLISSSTNDCCLSRKEPKSFDHNAYLLQYLFSSNVNFFSPSLSFSFLQSHISTGVISFAALSSSQPLDLLIYMKLLYQVQRLFVFFLLTILFCLTNSSNSAADTCKLVAGLILSIQILGISTKKIGIKLLIPTFSTLYHFWS